MASPKSPWQRLWCIIWHRIPEPLVDGRLLVVLDDTVNTKSGRTIFGCGLFHDPTAKLNQPSYPWSQHIVSLGLLKIIKGRWSCLPLAFRFYFMKRDIEAHKIPTQKLSRTVTFQSKRAQAVEMLKELAGQFDGTPILVVADSWFGNEGLYRPLSQAEFEFQLLSRLRSNMRLYDLPPKRRHPKQRGAGRKYDTRLGSTADLAALYQKKARAVSVFLYGKQREVRASEHVVTVKNLRGQIRGVWGFRKTQWSPYSPRT